MWYDRGDSFPSDFKPNGIPFGSNLKLNCHDDHIPFNMKGKGNIVFSVESLVFAKCGGLFWWGMAITLYIGNYYVF